MLSSALKNNLRLIKKPHLRCWLSEFVFLASAIKQFNPLDVRLTKKYL